MVVCPGRYFDRVAMIDLPKGICGDHGGDMMAVIWRLDDKPEEWILTWRIRYNGGPNTSPWDYSEKGDRKSWHVHKGGGGEETRKKMVEMIAMLPLMGSAAMKVEPLNIDWLIIKGGPDEFFEVTRREKKSWMHTREEKI